MALFMSGGGLVWGSLATYFGMVLAAAIPFGYAVLTGFNLLFFRWTKNFPAVRFFQVLISLVFSAVLSLMISATVSTFFRSTAVATTVSYGVLLLIFAGTMVVWANLGAPFSHDFVQKVLSLNPMAGAPNVMQVSGFESFELVPRTWWVTGIICLLLYIILHIRTWKLCQPD